MVDAYRGGTRNELRPIPPCGQNIFNTVPKSHLLSNFYCVAGGVSPIRSGRARGYLPPKATHHPTGWVVCQCGFSSDPWNCSSASPGDPPTVHRVSAETTASGPPPRAAPIDGRQKETSQHRPTPSQLIHVVQEGECEPLPRYLITRWSSEAKKGSRLPAPGCQSGRGDLRRECS